MGAEIQIREADESDRVFVRDVMSEALGPYYGGDHAAHAERIFCTHISGGKDPIGFFSREQKMFIAMVSTARAGVLHIVGKRQGTFKISPLIVAKSFQGKRGIGSRLLTFAEDYARSSGARQIYCTVARQNLGALQFFLRKGYTAAGQSDSHYKQGITESMLYKRLLFNEHEQLFDKPHISVLPSTVQDEDQVRALLLSHLPSHFYGIDDSWVDSLFKGYKRSVTKDVNDKYKLIYVASDRSNKILGVVGATPKKGEPIKLMPFIATSLPAFAALVTDLPFALKSFGHKVYIHITPSAEETIVLQQQGWNLDAVLPEAYHNDVVTQQWSLNILSENIMRTMRLKQRFLDYVRDGHKTLEVRVAYPHVTSISPGERIRFMSRTETEIVKVKAVRRYDSFEKMLLVEAPEKIVPGVTLDELTRLLHEIYPPSKESLGVVVLEVQPETER
jgi:ASC-1-like (ASCH) protein/predicted N-acetyltransferase YhbS